MANEFIVKNGLKVTGSANIQTSVVTPTLTVSGTGSFGNVTVAGNLDVQGTINAVNETNLNVADKVISVAAGATSTSQADGAGLFISGANASILWSDGASAIIVNKPMSIGGTLDAIALAGNGAGITDLSPSNISSGTAGIDITGNASGLTNGAGAFINWDTIVGTNWSISGNVVSGDSITANGFIGNLTGNADTATTSSYTLEALTASYATQALNSLYSQTASLANKANILENSLSNGDGISLFTFNGSSAQTVALDSSVVRTTGNQTIAGVKTFTDNIVLTPASTQQTILNKQQSVSVTTSTTTVSSLSVTNVDAVFFDYVVKNSTTDLRTGTVMAVTNGSTVEYTETSTNDIGNTSGVTLSVDINSGNIRLRATAASGTWTVRAFARTI